MKLASLRRMLAIAMLSSIATGVFAEEAAAPVYDVDNYPPQFDGSSEANSAAPAAQPDLQPELQANRQEPDDEPTVSTPRASGSSLTLDQRVRRVEQQVNNAQQSGSSAKIDALQNQVQTLRGQVEELTHQLQQLQTQQRAMAIDVDKRLSQQATAAPVASTPTPVVATTASDDKATKPSATDKTPAKPASVSSSAVPLVKSTATTVASVPKASSDSQPNVAEEQQIYQTAYDLIKAKKYNEAVAALQKMLQKYPAGQFAANAHYWLGELYGLLNKNDLSAQEFLTVVNNYPDSPKIADAQLKVGLVYAGQFKWPDAKAAFKRVINHYPGTSSARLASEQLKQIKLAGH